MKCPRCGGKSRVRKVHLEDEHGIKTRWHKCVNGHNFFSEQGSRINVIKHVQRQNFKEKYPQ